MALGSVNALRVLAGLSWAELARRAEVPASLTQDLRRHGHAGENRPEYVARIAAVLGVAPERLSDPAAPVIGNGRHRGRRRPAVSTMSEREFLIEVAIDGIADDARLDRLAAVIESHRRRRDNAAAFAAS
jgi:hypothetical protein